eukprot:scaffold243731_cov22-Prasinocladus_malaysianus.AAC.1
MYINKHPSYISNTANKPSCRQLSAMGLLHPRVTLPQTTKTTTATTVAESNISYAAGKSLGQAADVSVRSGDHPKLAVLREEADLVGPPVLRAPLGVVQVDPGVHLAPLGVQQQPPALVLELLQLERPARVVAVVVRGA